MGTAAQKSAPQVESFDEKQFYLDEFRGKTLLFAIPDDCLKREDDYLQLAAVTRELLANDTRIVVLVGVTHAAAAEQVQRRLQRRFAPLVFREDTLSLFPQRGARNGVFVRLNAPAVSTSFLATIWMTLRRGPLFVGTVQETPAPVLLEMAQEVATRLRVHKLVLIDRTGGVTGEDGEAISFFDPSLLQAVLGVGEAEWAGLGRWRTLLETAGRTLAGGVSSVNLCTLDGLARELFTYVGSGTLFTQADYCTVQRLGIDDFEEVERLIERGQREGLLKPRGPEEVARMLVQGYGASIGAHHLAGVCALDMESYRDAGAAEIVGLYTITRFKGEGVGGRLIARVIADAQAAGMAYVFACTTEERAQIFFEREGFRFVGPDDIPAAKWVGYDAERRAHVAILRKDLKPVP